MARGHSFPQCGGARASSWLQPGGKEVSWASALGSLVAPGPVELLPKADLQAWGGVHCGLFLVCEAGTAQVPGGTSFGVERAGSSCMVFLFHLPVPSHSPTPVLLSQCQL